MRLRGLIDGGEAQDSAWVMVVGPRRTGTTFREFALEVYLPDREGEFSNDNWKYAVRRLVDVFGNQPVGSISFGDIKAFVNSLRRAEYSASRIRDYVGQLSGMFRLAVRMGLRQDNPVQRADSKEHAAIWPSDSISQRARKYLKAEEIEILVKAAMLVEVEGQLVPYVPGKHLRREDTRWLAPVIRIAFETGMRRSEILGLTWDRVYLGQGEHHPNGHIRLEASDTKTKRGRLVPLSPMAALTLKKQDIIREGQNPVFVGRTGKTKPDLRKAWAEVLRRARCLGLDQSLERTSDLNFHDLRASWAVDSLANGAHLQQVKEVGGWSSLPAMQRYLRCVEDDMDSLHTAYQKRTDRQKAPGLFVEEL